MILFTISVVLLVGGFWLLIEHIPTAEEKADGSDEYRGERKFAYFVISAGVILAIVSCFTIVPTGNVGVPVTLGKVGSSPIPEGLHYAGPLASVEDMSVHIETYTVTEQNGPDSDVTTNLVSADAITKDDKPVTLQLTFLYRLHAEDSLAVYKEFGTGYPDNILKPALEATAGNVVAGYDSVEIGTTKRADLPEAIKKNMNAVITETLHTKLNPNVTGISVEKVFVRSIAFPGSSQAK
jgi:regulator of protease activity HflC (stomatin/prohibitin superfamily)